MKDAPQLNPWRLFVGSMVPNWLMERREISAGAKLTYARLCLYAGRHGVAFPTQLELAANLGVTDRQARRYLKELAAHGLIDIHRTGLRRANRITFALHPWMGGGTVEKVWRKPPDRTDTSAQKGTHPSGPIGKDSVEVDSVKEARRGRAPGRKRGGQTEALLTPGPQAGETAALVQGLTGALAMPPNGAADAATARRADSDHDAAAVRHRLEMLPAKERAELDRFIGWLRRAKASDDECRAIVSELLSGDIANPYAYFAAGSDARERIRRQFA